MPEVLDATMILQRQGLRARILDMFMIKPLDEQAIITTENHNIYGGLGSTVAEVLVENRCRIPFHRMGFPDTLGKTTTVEYMLQKYGLDASSVASKTLEI